MSHLLYIILTIFWALLPSVSVASDAVLYVEITDETEHTDYTAGFLSQFETALADEGIRLVTIQTPDDYLTHEQFWLQRSLHLIFFDHGVMVTPYVTHRISTSPALASAFRYSSYVTLQPDDAALNLALGISLYIYERCDAATGYFDAITPEHTYNDIPTRWSLDFYRGNCALIEDDLTGALAYYNRLLDHAEDTKLTDFIDVAANKAWILVQQEETAAAFDLMGQVIEAAQQDDTTAAIYEYAQALTFRARLYALTFDFDQAMADMDAAITLQPDHPERYAERGQIIMLLYEWDRALADYNTALELDSTYAPAYFYRGVLYYSILEREPALADFEQYLALLPQGYNAPEAERYIESIRTELEALDD